MTEELTPETRDEENLQTLLSAAEGETVADLTPEWRKEEWFQNILDAIKGNELTYDLSPEWRRELWYAAFITAIQNSGGGCKLLASKDFDVTTTSTTETSVGEISLDGKLDDYTENDIIVVHVRDKAGKRDGYFYGCDQFFINHYAANGSTNALSTKATYRFTFANDAYGLSVSTYGVYGNTLYWKTTLKLTVSSKYGSSSSLTIDGTYKVDVYKWTPPFTLFE